MPKLDLDAIRPVNDTRYPAPHSEAVRGRWFRRLAPVSGITDFGASHVVLKPGAWSSQRHWHEDEDELLVMVTGAAVLVDESGRTPMGPGDIAVFPKGDRNGHCLINESDAECSFVVIGRPPVSDCHYPDIDMHSFAGIGFRHKDGTAFDA